MSGDFLKIFGFFATVGLVGLLMTQVSQGPRCKTYGGVLVRGAWFSLECVQPVRMVPKCPVCNDTDTVTAQDTPFGSTVTAEERKHVKTPVREIPCPMPDDQHSK